MQLTQKNCGNTKPNPKTKNEHLNYIMDYPKVFFSEVEGVSKCWNP